MCLGMPGMAEAQSANAKKAAAPAPTTSTVSSAPTRAIEPLRTKQISGFESNVVPLYQNISTFWNGLEPFRTKQISGFWGDLNSIYQTASTTSAIRPEHSNISAFWNTNGSLWSSSMVIWTKIDAGTATATERSQLTANLTSVVNNSQTFWGPSITARLGGTFQSSFQTPLLAKYGITGTTPQSLTALTADKRAAFFVDWFDGLNGFTGYDQTDRWMLQANWSPHLTNVQGRGAGVVVGLVDTKLAGDADLLARVSYSGGSTAYSNVHGTAVASLIASAHDGRNIMGIAPGVKVAAYNPFDANAVASWKTVSKGIDDVASAGASVINLSLGDAGLAFSPKWDNALKDASRASSIVAVIAAGNEGLTQTKDVQWNQGKGVAFLVVGSVDANNVISSFSNRPGEACLRVNGQCNASAAFGKGGPLKNYFLVAPGENILASNGQGGVARYSGTSLAAPMVTGAIALLQGRWPWLKNFPVETAQIILRSAKDLGAPGVDAVYGWGMLDIQASQAPLNFNNLTYFTVKNGVSTAQTITAVRSSTNRAAWATQGAYITAFEVIGNTRRDFLLPISPSLVGAKVGNVFFQDFVQTRLVAWANAPALTNIGGHLSLSDRGAASTMPIGGRFKVSMRSRLVPIGPNERAMRNFRPENSVTVGDAKGRFSVTVGQGSNTLNGLQSGFGLESDYAPLDGGVNPILGFASGGAHANTSIAIRPDLRVTFGSSHSRVDRDGGNVVTIREGAADLAGARYAAAATNIQMDYSPRTWLSLSASYTALKEANGLLGVRSNTADGLVGASETDAYTLGASIAPAKSLLFSVSATRSNSRSRDSGAALRTGRDGLGASAFAFAVAKSGLFGASDQLRLSMSQPLAVSRGSVDLTTLAVVDRETGAQGAVTQSLAVQDRARLVGEVNYGLSLPSGLGEFSLFGRSDFRRDARNAQGVAGGARFRIGF